CPGELCPKQIARSMKPLTLAATIFIDHYSCIMSSLTSKETLAPNKHSRDLQQTTGSSSSHMDNGCYADNAFT
ncbi:hypothetical protein ACHAW6_003363, partial [Cyclotella cf. meneghiniana]